VQEELVELRTVAKELRRQLVEAQRTARTHRLETSAQQDAVKVLAAVARHVSRMETRLSEPLHAASLAPELAAAAAAGETDLWAMIQNATTEGALVARLEAIEQLLHAHVKEAKAAAAAAERRAGEQRHAEAVQVWPILSVETSAAPCNSELWPDPNPNR
jgi:hypothetical protein